MRAFTAAAFCFILISLPRFSATLMSASLGGQSSSITLYFLQHVLDGAGLANGVKDLLGPEQAIRIAICPQSSSLSCPYDILISLPLRDMPPHRMETPQCQCFFFVTSSSSSSTKQERERGITIHRNHRQMVDGFDIPPTSAALQFEEVDRTSHDHWRADATCGLSCVCATHIRTRSLIRG